MDYVSLGKSNPQEKAMIAIQDLRFSHIVATSASVDRIWQIWTDVAHWVDWDSELEYASLEGDLMLGASGVVKPKMGPICPFTIAEFEPKQSYTFTTRLFLCDLVERRSLSWDGTITSFTHEVSFEGLFARVFSLWLSRRFQTVLPSIMNKLKDLAEEDRSSAANIAFQTDCR